MESRVRLPIGRNSRRTQAPRRRRDLSTRVRLVSRPSARGRRRRGRLLGAAVEDVRRVGRPSRVRLDRWSRVWHLGMRCVLIQSRTPYMLPSVLVVVAPSQCLPIYASSPGHLRAAAILSKYELIDAEFVPLTHLDGYPRSAIAAVCRTPLGD